ncbi:MAG: hypothetical protein RXQ94_06695 [Caldivirga sp.]
MPNQQTQGLAVVGQPHASVVANQQSAVPVASQSVGSVVVDCRYCPGGCCGGLRGRRLPGHIVDLVRRIKVLLGLRYECEVINRYPELFCQRVRVGHGLGRVKELERLLSREVEYKASYVLGRLNECLNDAVCWRYLRLVVQGLVELNYANRGRGYHDVLSVRCRRCGRVIDATGPLSGVLFNIVRHFRVEHGLARPEDVEAKVAEGVFDYDVIAGGKEYFDVLMDEHVARVREAGWLDGLRCKLCGEVLKDNRYYIVLHFMAWHREKFLELGRGSGVVRQPGTVKLFEEAAREVAQRLGVNYEVAFGAVKTVHSIVNIEGVLGVDEIAMHLGWYDPELTLKLSDINVRQLILAVKEALDARGLIDVRVKAKAEPKPETQVKPESKPKDNGNHSSEGGECRPEDIGAKPSDDPSSVLYQLACELYREFGKRGDYMALARVLLSELKKGTKCSEKTLEKLGYGNVKPIIKALRKLKLC